MARFNIKDCLHSTELIDFLTPAVQIKAEELVKKSKSAEETIKRIYLFVRDDIVHSNDIETDELTSSASDVLCAGHGLCYAKAHLFAALCRYHGIPCALCYQLIDGDGRNVVHGLNAVWLEGEQRWVRLDARGNTKGIAAEFSLTKESLAFPDAVTIDGYFADTPQAIANFLTLTPTLTQARNTYPSSL